MPLYAYGALSARNQASASNAAWRTLLADQGNVRYFVPAVYYGLITAGGLHLVSLSISLWLGVMFRRITMLPPDMNPLESHLTSRAHKRNKSSVVTIDSDRRLTAMSERPLSQVELSKPPSVPFMHTRQNSQVTLANGNYDARLDLPSRQYQIPHNNSAGDIAAAKRMSAPPSRSSAYPANRGNYTEIPLGDAYENHPPSPVPSGDRNSAVSSGRPEIVPAAQTAQPRAAKFSEAWYASESLVNRTQQRTRAMNAATKRRTYEALDQRYNISPESDSEDENNHDYTHPSRRRPHSYHPSSLPVNNENDIGDLSAHPNPLRSHPTDASSEYIPGPPSTTASPPPRRKTPFARVRNSVLSAINLNDRRVSGTGQDITDSRWEQGRDRDSSIQLDSDFYAKPYGELKPGTPPIMIGGNDHGNRQVSSGNDYDLAGSNNGVFGRRHVSGKIAEEGRAGNRFSRYDTVDE